MVLTIKERKEREEEYLDFLLKMPLSEEQKIKFTEKYIEILERMNKQEEECKEHFEKEVLKDIENISPPVGL